MIVKKNRDEIEQYLVDAANFQGSCDKVFIPENKEDVIKLFSAANAEKKPVTICGNHTSLTGSSVPS
jgi:FAD/FMN-containing dehydrogenase